MLWLLTSLLQPTFAQIDFRTYSQTFNSDIQDNAKKIGIMVLIKQENDSFWVTNNSNAISEALSSDKHFINSRPAKFPIVMMFDTSQALFFIHGVDKSNATFFEYRVSIYHNLDSVLWRSVNDLRGVFNNQIPGFPQMAFLGGYNSRYGDWLIIDVRKKSTKEIVATAVVVRKPIKPILLDIFTSNELNEFLSTLRHPDSYKIKQKEINKWKARYKPDQIDQITQLPKLLSLSADEKSLIFYLKADIRDRKLVEYELTKDNKIISPWKSNDFDNNFIWLKALDPGNYRVKFRYSVQKKNETSYDFTISPSWYQTGMVKVSGGIIVAGIIGLVIWVFFLLKQQADNKRELKKRERLQFDLQTIRSQLNPHFTFNALNSIQSLYNRAEQDKGNIYLAEFSQLLRSTLNYTKTEYVPLAEELQILNTYLKLEQLRFDFKYEIYVDDRINTFETEIPSFLLHPLIENAVKHGIFELASDGFIQLRIEMENDDMIIIISDNGSGFLENGSGGLGLKLTRERIDLLNKISPENTILLLIKGKENGLFNISLKFKNWFYGKHLLNN